MAAVGCCCCCVRVCLLHRLAAACRHRSASNPSRLIQVPGPASTYSGVYAHERGKACVGTWRGLSSRASLTPDVCGIGDGHAGVCRFQHLAPWRMGGFRRCSRVVRVRAAGRVVGTAHRHDASWLVQLGRRGCHYNRSATPYGALCFCFVGCDARIKRSLALRPQVALWMNSWTASPPSSQLTSWTPFTHRRAR